MFLKSEMKIYMREDLFASIEGAKQESGSSRCHIPLRSALADPGAARAGMTLESHRLEAKGPGLLPGLTNCWRWAVPGEE